MTTIDNRVFPDMASACSPIGTLKGFRLFIESVIIFIILFLVGNASSMIRQNPFQSTLIQLKYSKGAVSTFLIPMYEVFDENLTPCYIGNPNNQPYLMYKICRMLSNHRLHYFHMYSYISVCIFPELLITCHGYL